MEILVLGFETAAILAERNARRGFRDFVPTIINDLDSAIANRKEILSLKTRSFEGEETCS